MSTSTITRRAALTGTAAGAAAIVAGAGPTLAEDHDRDRAIRSLIADIRLLSKSTACETYSVLHAVGDRLERALGGDTTNALVAYRRLFEHMEADDAKMATTVIVPYEPTWPGLRRAMAGDLLRGAS